MLYILVAGILTGILPYTKLNVPSPVSYSLIQIGLGWAGAIVAVGAIAGLTTVLLVLLYGQSRIFFAMARDGMLPASSPIHPRFRTPYLSSALIGVVVAVVAGVGKLDVVADLVNVGTLAAFVLVSIGVVILRRRRPDMERKFRVPASPFVPILSAVLAVALALKGLPGRTLLSYMVWLAIGLAIYFAYSRRRSKVGDEAAPAAEAARAQRVRVGVMPHAAPCARPGYGACWKSGVPTRPFKTNCTARAARMIPSTRVTTWIPVVPMRCMNREAPRMHSHVMARATA